MKWPSDLDFGEEVLIVIREYVQNSDEEELSLSNGDNYAPDDPSLIGVFRVPE